MLDFTITDVSELNSISGVISAEMETVKEAARIAAYKAMSAGEADVIKTTPADYGAARQSWRVRDLPSSREVFRYELTSDCPYIMVLDQGRRAYPGDPSKWPPLTPLVGWVIRKGLVKTNVLKSTEEGKAWSKKYKRMKRANKAAGSPWDEGLEETRQEGVKMMEAPARAIAAAIRRKIGMEGTKGHYIADQVWPDIVDRFRAELSHNLRSV